MRRVPFYSRVRPANVSETSGPPFVSSLRSRRIKPEIAGGGLILRAQISLTLPSRAVHDVLADLRAILSPSGLSDAEIETGLLPALQQFHETQFTPVQLAAADSNHKALVTPANKLQEGEFVEPRTGTVFSFDHVKEVRWSCYRSLVRHPIPATEKGSLIDSVDG